MTKNISRKNLVYNLILVLALSIGVLALIVKGQDRQSLLAVLVSAKGLYLFFGIILSLGFILGEAINIRMILRIFDYRLPLLRTLKYAFTGFFFSSITPSSTGGQPMQVYEMKKDGVEVHHSSLVLLIELMAYQGVTVVYGLAGLVWASKNNLIESSLVVYMVISGLVLNILGMCFISLCIFNPSVSYKIAGGLELILRKLPFKGEKKREIIVNLRAEIEEYNKCSLYLRGNYLIFLKVFLVTMFELGSLFSISYLIYLALGQEGRSLGEVVMVQALIYVGSSFIPLPGAVGVSESNFLSMFKNIYRENLLSGALLLSRGISFYLLLFISFLSLIIYRLVDSRRVSLKK